MKGEHPEIRPGEMFLTNAVKDDYYKISYKTKRMGMVAYDNSCYAIKELYPVFVNKDEYENFMIDLGMRG